MKKQLIGTMIAGTLLMTGCSNEKADASFIDSLKNIVNKATEQVKPASVNSPSDEKLIKLTYSKAKYPENMVDIDGGDTKLNTTDNQIIKGKGTNAWQQYSKVDMYGRAGKAIALVDYKTVNEHSSAYMKQNGYNYKGKTIYERPDFPSYVHVSGEYKNGFFDKSSGQWKCLASKGCTGSNNAQTNLGSYRGWLYNKSHTIAWSLGGDMEIHNVTLGTRAQNVGTNRDANGGGMAHMETQVRKAVNANHSLKVYIEVTPLYKGTELVPRGSKVRAYSLNDNGKAVNLNEWVFNAQDGVSINYATGSWK